MAYTLDVGIVFLLPPSMGEIKVAARAELLEKELAHRLGRKVRVETAASYTEIETRLADGTADVAWAPPSVAASVSRHVRSTLKVIRRGGTSSYVAALVCSTDAKLTIDRLAGKRAA